MRKYIDWADWAGDNSQEAEAELRAEREARLLNPVPHTCEVEGHEFHVGVCLICEVEDEYFEPSDAQIPGTYDVRKAVA